MCLDREGKVLLPRRPHLQVIRTILQQVNFLTNDIRDTLDQRDIRLVIALGNTNASHVVIQELFVGQTLEADQRGCA